MHPPTAEKREWFLEKQIETLSRLEHSLDKIVFINPIYSLAPQSYLDYINCMPKQIGDTQVIVHFDVNHGMSYGSWSRNISKYMADYNFIIEDDYFFTQDNFDQIFVDEIEKRNCGYLSMHVGNGGGVYRYHAAVPMGCITKAAAEEVISKFGKLPFADTEKDYTRAEAGQVDFGNAFYELGLLDELDTYECSLSMLGKVHYIREGLPKIIVPAQLI